MAGRDDNLTSMQALKERMRSVLSETRTIAVVGASPNPARPSHQVAAYLVRHGYEVIPVRPNVGEILGKKCYPRLEDIPAAVDIVDVFRRPEACPGIARQAVAIRARALWLQERIVSPEAARIAGSAGMEVFMDRCIKKAHKHFFKNAALWKKY